MVGDDQCCGQFVRLPVLDPDGGEDTAQDVRFHGFFAMCLFHLRKDAYSRLRLVPVLGREDFLHLIVEIVFLADVHHAPDDLVMVDVILANFTVTPERAEEVDFASPYMNVSLGVVSKDDNVITSLDNWNADDSIIVISGTTAETYLIANYPDIPLQKFDSYATAKEAFENGTSVAWANDNTEVIAFALQNEGYTVGIPSLGSADTIAPAVSKGNTTLLDWINDEIVALGEENFFHADYEATLADTYGLDYEDSLVVEGGKVNAQ